MLAFMEEHPEKIAELIELSVIDDQPLSWRAAWLLSDCMEENDVRVKPYIDKMLANINRVKDGQKRDLINILRKMEVDEEQEGLLFDTCADLWSKTDKIPSVRWVALKLMMKTTEKHPELFHEIDFLTQDHYLETLSPGIKHSIKRLLKDYRNKRSLQ